jgi:hypothetical protein
MSPLALIVLFSACERIHLGHRDKLRNQICAVLRKWASPCCTRDVELYTALFASKFRSGNEVYLFLALSVQIGVTNISRHDIQVV